MWATPIYGRARPETAGGSLRCVVVKGEGEVKKRERKPVVPASPDAIFLRLPQVLLKIPLSRSTWWAGIKSGRYPKPVKLGPRTSAWRRSDIDALCERVAGDGGTEVVRELITREVSDECNSRGGENTTS